MNYAPYQIDTGTFAADQVAQDAMFAGTPVASVPGASAFMNQVQTFWSGAIASASPGNAIAGAMGITPGSVVPPGYSVVDPANPASSWNPSALITKYGVSAMAIIVGTIMAWVGLSGIAASGKSAQVDVIRG